MAWYGEPSIDGASPLSCQYAVAVQAWVILCEYLAHILRICSSRKDFTISNM